jgi:quinol monooxygenase YgiN
MATAMNDTCIHVTARLCARRDKQDALRQELMSLLEPTRNEPGCLRYELYQQSGQGENFLFVEQWRSVADLERHLQQPHVQAFIQKSDVLLAEPMQVAQWNQAG